MDLNLDLHSQNAYQKLQDHGESEILLHHQQQQQQQQRYHSEEAKDGCHSAILEQLAHEDEQMNGLEESSTSTSSSSSSPSLDCSIARSDQQDNNSRQLESLFEASEQTSVEASSSSSPSSSSCRSSDTPLKASSDSSSEEQQSESCRDLQTDADQSKTAQPSGSPAIDGQEEDEDDEANDDDAFVALCTDASFVLNNDPSRRYYINKLYQPLNGGGGQPNSNQETESLVEHDDEYLLYQELRSLEPAVFKSTTDERQRVRLTKILEDDEGEEIHLDGDDDDDDDDDDEDRVRQRELNSHQLHLATIIEDFESFSSPSSLNDDSQGDAKVHRMSLIEAAAAADERQSPNDHQDDSGRGRSYASPPTSCESIQSHCSPDFAIVSASEGDFVDHFERASYDFSAQQANVQTILCADQQSEQQKNHQQQQQIRNHLQEDSSITSEIDSCFGEVDSFIMQQATPITTNFSSPVEESRAPSAEMEDLSSINTTASIAAAEKLVASPQVDLDSRQQRRPSKVSEKCTSSVSKQQRSVAATAANNKCRSGRRKTIQRASIDCVSSSGLDNNKSKNQGDVPASEQLLVVNSNSNTNTTNGSALEPQPYHQAPDLIQSTRRSPPSQSEQEDELSMDESYSVDSERGEQRVSSKYRRRTANARERIRMREINQAFEKLKKVVPIELIQSVQGSGNESDQSNCTRKGKGASGGESSESVKLTKITTLRLAVSYIAKLSEVLEQHPLPPSAAALADDCDNRIGGGGGGESSAAAATTGVIKIPPSNANKRRASGQQQQQSQLTSTGGRRRRAPKRPASGAGDGKSSLAASAKRRAKPETITATTSVPMTSAGSEFSCQNKQANQHQQQQVSSTTTANAIVLSHPMAASNSNSISNHNHHQQQQQHPIIIANNMIGRTGLLSTNNGYISFQPQSNSGKQQSSGNNLNFSPFSSNNNNNQQHLTATISQAAANCQEQRTFVTPVAVAILGIPTGGQGGLVRAEPQTVQLLGIQSAQQFKGFQQQQQLQHQSYSIVSTQQQQQQQQHVGQPVTLTLDDANNLSILRLANPSAAASNRQQQQQQHHHSQFIQISHDGSSSSAATTTTSNNNTTMAQQFHLATTVTGSSHSPSLQQSNSIAPQQQQQLTSNHHYNYGPYPIQISQIHHQPPSSGSGGAQTFTAKHQFQHQQPPPIVTFHHYQANSGGGGANSTGAHQQQQQQQQQLGEQTTGMSSDSPKSVESLGQQLAATSVPFVTQPGGGGGGGTTGSLMINLGQPLQATSQQLMHVNAANLISSKGPLSGQSAQVIQFDSRTISNDMNSQQQQQRNRTEPAAANQPLAQFERINFTTTTSSGSGSGAHQMVAAAAGNQAAASDNEANIRHLVASLTTIIHPQANAKRHRSGDPSPPDSQQKDLKCKQQQQQQQQPTRQQSAPVMRTYRFHNYDGNMITNSLYGSGGQDKLNASQQQQQQQQSNQRSSKKINHSQQQTIAAEQQQQQMTSGSQRSRQNSLSSTCSSSSSSSSSLTSIGQRSAALSRQATTTVAVAPLPPAVHGV